MKNWPTLLFTLICLSWNITASAHEVNDLKAAYIYKFTEFITWPESTNNRQNFVILVVGNSNVYLSLNKNLENKKIKGKKVSILYLKNLNNYHQLSTNVPHLVFMNCSNRMSARSSPLQKSYPAVTICDTRENSRQKTNAVIDLKYSDKRLSFNINNQLAKSKQIDISSQLLRLAEDVQ